MCLINQRYLSPLIMVESYVTGSDHFEKCLWWRLLHMGHSMPTHSLFSQPISDFDEIWQTDWPFRETNTHQVSAHYHHYWWSYSTSKISEIYQNFRLWDTKYTLTRKVTNWFLKPWYRWKEETISFPTICYLMTFWDIWPFKVIFWDLDLWPTFSEIPILQFSWILGRRCLVM